MKCSKCGEDNDDESQFCYICGNELNSKINVNFLVICLTIIICVVIIATAIALVNNTGSDESTVNSSSEISKTELISESKYDDSSNARLGSRENPKTSIDYNDGTHEGELNPNYGDYYYLDGGLYRDDNKYLIGAGTYTFISGNDPYEY